MTKSSDFDVPKMWLPKDWVRSKAFWELGGKAVQVLFELWRRVRWVKTGKDGSACWVPANSGQIHFRESEARKYGMSRGALRRAFEQLAERGFVRKTRGGGNDHLPCKFTLVWEYRRHGMIKHKGMAQPNNKPKKPGPKPGTCPSCGYAYDGEGVCESCRDFTREGGRKQNIGGVGNETMVRKTASVANCQCTENGT